MQKENAKVVVKLVCFPGEFLSGVSRFFVSDKWDDLRKKIGRCQITTLRQNKSFCYNSHSGFTLIELLVVVLIIGILAAVAVPQYKMAVYKARMTEALAVLPTLTNAHRVYEMTTGESTDDLSLLDVEVPGNRGTSSWTGKNDNDPNHYYFSCTSVHGGHCVANAANVDLPLLEINHSGQSTCIKFTGKSDVAERLCKSMGTYDEESSTNNGYAYYRL